MKMNVDFQTLELDTLTGHRTSPDYFLLNFYLKSVAEGVQLTANLSAIETKEMMYPILPNEYNHFY